MVRCCGRSPLFRTHRVSHSLRLLRFSLLVVICLMCRVILGWIYWATKAIGRWVNTWHGLHHAHIVTKLLRIRSHDWQLVSPTPGPSHRQITALHHDCNLLGILLMSLVTTCCRPSLLWRCRRDLSDDVLLGVDQFRCGLEIALGLGPDADLGSSRGGRSSVVRSNEPLFFVGGRRWLSDD